MIYKKTQNNKPNNNKTKKNRVYNIAEYNSGDGMLTTVWGPGL